jgi:hypothetical protein
VELRGALGLLGLLGLAAARGARVRGMVARNADAGAKRKALSGEYGPRSSFCTGSCSDELKPYQHSDRTPSGSDSKLTHF